RSPAAPPRTAGPMLRGRTGWGHRLDGSTACTSLLPPCPGWSPSRRTAGKEKDTSGDAVTDPPDGDGEQGDGEASEDRSLDSLQQPEAARRLVDGQVEDVMRLHAPDVAFVRAA